MGGKIKKICQDRCSQHLHRFHSHFPAISPQGAGRSPGLQLRLCQIVRDLISGIGTNPSKQCLVSHPGRSTFPHSQACPACAKLHPNSEVWIHYQPLGIWTQTWKTILISPLTLASWLLLSLKLKFARPRPQCTSCSTEQKSCSWPEKLTKSTYQKCQRAHHNSMLLFLTPMKKSTKMFLSLGQTERCEGKTNNQKEWSQARSYWKQRKFSPL